jgi:hypothetical protein
MNELVEIKLPVFSSLEEAVSYGMELRARVDGLQWHFGDYAVEVEQDLGQGALEEVATEINVQIGTIRRYRDVAKKYPAEIRAKYPRLSWTHFRNAYGAESPETWLEKADSESWSAGMLSVQVNSKGNVKIEEVPRMVQCVHDNKWYLVGKNVCKENGKHFDA